MNDRQTFLVTTILVLMAFAVGIYLYPSLPDPMPTHWNSAGDIDRYGSKPFTVFLMPAIGLMIWILMVFVKRFSPKGFKVESFAGTVNVIQVILIGFNTAIGIIWLLIANNPEMQIGIAIGVAIGVLSMALGNYMGRVRKNFFIGIRTPWTLASDEVWIRTHRLAAWLLMISGCVAVAGSIGGMPLIVSTALITSALMIPAIYSFFAYRNLEGFSEAP